MSFATARGLNPETRKGRTAIRPFANLNNHDGIADSTSDLRVQFLAKLGLAPGRARLVSTLAWEGHNEH